MKGLGSMVQKPRACKSIADLKVGERFTVEYRITDDDLLKFAEISGDWNPVHFDEDYASASMFKKRIAHGMISVAKFSGIFGMDMPGLGTLWETQDVRFLAPVYLEQPYRAVAVVVSLDRKRATIATWVEDEAGNRVLEGSAAVIPIGEGAKRRLAASF